MSVETPMAWCPSCGRRGPVEEMVQVGEHLVCEPCHEEAVKAEDRRDSIDAAWAAVEAALPKGWLISGLTFMGVNGGRGDWPSNVPPNAVGYADAWWQAGAATSRDGEDLEQWAHGPTPAMALRALGAKLAEGP